MGSYNIREELQEAQEVLRKFTEDDAVIASIEKAATLMADAIRSGCPLEVLENLQEIEDEGDVYESIEDIWPDYPTKEDFLFNEDEY